MAVQIGFGELADPVKLTPFLIPHSSFLIELLSPRKETSRIGTDEEEQKNDRHDHSDHGHQDFMFSFHW